MLEISKMLTLSTAHITPEAAHFIEDNQLESFGNEYAYILFSDIDSTCREIAPECLIKALNFALANKCEWLRLDRDVPQVYSLPVYNW